ncbi:hypothetical protein C8R43DRAFT_1022824 [Mycena crocata]|nr:hypothetical protein C8R43DRAFT_1022824 [Mycena crocata]
MRTEGPGLDGFEGDVISAQQPGNDLWIEWVYEIDLDHEVFLVDTDPLFALNNMPCSAEEFKSASALTRMATDLILPRPRRNIYITGNRHPSWWATVSLTTTQLASQVSIGRCEAVRIGLYELLVNQATRMQYWGVGHYVRILETASDRSQISLELLQMGVSMVDLVVGPMLLGSRYSVKAPHKVEEFSWLSPEICLRITTHLDDERNLKKNTLELVDQVALNRQPGTVTFGILFSPFFHCVIVCVEADDEFKSTPALQFLPSFHADFPSTPGIIAVARLAFHCFSTLKARDAGVTALPPNHFLSCVPIDVLGHIGEYLGLSEVQNLRVVLPLSEPVATALLRYPHIKDYRLLDVAWEPSKKLGNEEDSEENNTEENNTIRNILKYKAFLAVHQGSIVPELLVGRRGYGAEALQFKVHFRMGNNTTEIECGVSGPPLVQPSAIDSHMAV